MRDSHLDKAWEENMREMELALLGHFSKRPTPRATPAPQAAEKPPISDPQPVPSLPERLYTNTKRNRPALIYMLAAHLVEGATPEEAALATLSTYGVGDGSEWANAYGQIQVTLLAEYMYEHSLHTRLIQGGQ